MAAGNVSSINVTLDVDDKGTVKVRQFAGESAKAGDKSEKAFDRSKKSLHDFNLKAVAAKIALVGLAAAAAGIATAFVVFNKLKSVISEMVGLAKVQEEAEAKVAAVIESTGHAAGFTLGELKKMASGMQALTGVGDETILNAQSILLTFKQIRGEAFERTTKAALDVSAVMGQDLNSSMVQLGKALNDPIANLGALSRTGIQFTNDQKEMIKTLWEAGREAEAQAVILKELESQFGGAAEALRNTFGGAVQGAAGDFGDLKEELGFVITKNQFFIDLVNKAAGYFRQWSAYIAENREEMMALAKNGIVAIVGGIEKVLSVIKFFHSAWLDIKLAGTAAIDAIVKSMSFLFDALKKTSLGPLNLLMEGLDKLGAIETNPFDTIDQTFEDLKWATKTNMEEISKEIASVEGKYTGVIDTVQKLKKEIESMESGKVTAPEITRRTPVGGDMPSADVIKQLQLAKAMTESRKKALDDLAKMSQDTEFKIQTFGKSTFEIEMARIADLEKAWKAAGLKEVEYTNTKNDMIKLAELNRDAELKKQQDSFLGDMGQAFAGWANSYTSSLNDMLWSSELTFDGILESFGRMLTEMLLQSATKDILGGLLGTGGNGGIGGGCLYRRRH